MSTIKVRKLIGWTLVLLAGYFLFSLSTTFRGLEHEFVFSDSSSANNGQEPRTTVRGSLPSEYRPSDDTRPVIRPKDKYNPQGLTNAPKDLSNLPSDIPPPTTRLDPSIKYLSYMPFAGLTNQFIALENAAYLALRLNRTLIIPPITSNVHDKHNSNQRWSDYFDLPRFASLSGLQIVEWSDIRPFTPEQAEVGAQQARMGRRSFPLWESLAENLTCQVIYGYGDSAPVRGSDMTFARQFLFRPQFVRPPPPNPKTKVYDRQSINVKDNSNMEDIVVIDDLLDRYATNKDQLLFLSHTYKLKDPIAKRAWSDAAQYLYFGPKVMDYAKRLIEHRAPETKENGQYIAIHIRRGDIWMKCASKSPEALVTCVIPFGFYAEQVQKAQQIAGKKLPVIVTTDSKSPDDHLTIIRLGWRRLNHDLYTTEEELGIFGPAMVDAAILANAEVLIGSRSSTMSRVAQQRQMSWHE